MAEESSGRQDTTTLTPALPREIAPGIYWLGGCSEVRVDEQAMHMHMSVYLIKGPSASLLVDTGSPRNWPLIADQLDVLLPARNLTWIFPTHLEYPHCGALDMALEKYPQARVICESSDYALYYPHLVSNVTHVDAGDEVDLGDGYRFVFVDAVLKDLVNTLWGYERSQQVMFVVDGFSFTHHKGLDDEPLHRPGECALVSSELPEPPSVDAAAQLNAAAMWWTRYREIDPFLARLRALFVQFPTKAVAPSHGGVIDDIDGFLPILQEAHDRSFREPRTVSRSRT